MKEFFERIKADMANIEGIPYETYLDRCWGDSVVLDANTRLHRITSEPSVQFHEFRTEEYILIAGAKLPIYRGSLFQSDPERTVASLQRTVMTPGDKIIITPGTVHLPVPLSEESSTFIEISHGVYRERDVGRVYDKNGRDEDLREWWSERGYETGLSIVDLIPLVRSRLES